MAEWRSQRMFQNSPVDGMLPSWDEAAHPRVSTPEAFSEDWHGCLKRENWGTGCVFECPAFLAAVLSAVILKVLTQFLGCLPRNEISKMTTIHETFRIKIETRHEPRNEHRGGGGRKQHLTSIDLKEILLFIIMLTALRWSWSWVGL